MAKGLPIKGSSNVRPCMLNQELLFSHTALIFHDMNIGD